MSEWTLPTIDLERCTGCGLCVEYCPTQAVKLDQQQKPIIVQPQNCSYCGLCEETCPVGAIALSYEIDILTPGGQDETTNRPNR